MSKHRLNGAAERAPEPWPGRIPGSNPAATRAASQGAGPEPGALLGSGAPPGPRAVSSQPVGAGSPEDSSTVFDDDATLLLLALAARRRGGPFAPLLRRLEAADGARWLLSAVPEACAEAGVSVAVLSNSKDGPGALRRLKSWAKRVLTGSVDQSSAAVGELPSDPRREVALLGYALAVAIGVTSHELRLSSRPPREWDPLFVDLAELAPMPWAETFRRAAGR